MLRWSIRRCAGLLKLVRLRSYPVVALVWLLAARAVTSDRRLLPVYFRAPLDGPPFWLRWSSSDARVLLEVFGDREYDVGGLEPVSPVRTVLDLGANIGAAAMALLSQFPAATIISVEPSPGNLAVLHQNAGRSPRWQVDGRAIADRSGTLTLYPSAWHSSDSTMAKVARARQSTCGRAENETAREPVLVPSTTVATLIAERALPNVDICKIDVEGAEELIFASGQDLAWLRDTGVIMVEIHDRYVDATKVRRTLAGAGFVAVRPPGPRHRTEIFVREGSVR